jgi:hypothetical protein
MAIKFVVADKRTIISKGREKFPAGAEVDAEKLGVTKKEFDVLVKDGSVVEAGKPPKSRASFEPSGEKGGE